MTFTTTQALHAAQHRLHDMYGLYAMQMCFRRTPDGFSGEMKAEHSALLTRTLAERRALQQMLPTEAANDPAGLPGAA